MGKIFESPDGGQTVYERNMGELTRELVKQNNKFHEQLMEDKLWGEIRRMGKVNPAMREQLDRVIMLYYLLKEEKNG